MDDIVSKDKDVIVLVGDLGYSFMEEFAKKHPDNFINCGCAEQNMVGVAAGLALGGKKPYVYSGSIFALMRPYEFVRDDVAYNNLDVKIVGTGASGFLGFTHNYEGTENEYDLVKNLPNIEYVEIKTEDQLLAALLNNKPSFIRL